MVVFATRGGVRELDPVVDVILQKRRVRRQQCRRVHTLRTVGVGDVAGGAGDAMRCGAATLGSGFSSSSDSSAPYALFACAALDTSGTAP